MASLPFPLFSPSKPTFLPLLLLFSTLTFFSLSSSTVSIPPQGRISEAQCTKVLLNLQLTRTEALLLDTTA